MYGDKGYETLAETVSAGKADYYDILPLLEELEDLRTIVWLIAEATHIDSPGWLPNDELAQRVDVILEEAGIV